MAHRLFKTTFGVLVSLALLAPVGRVFAQQPAAPSGGEQILSFDSDITVNQDSTMQVRETVVLVVPGATKTDTLLGIPDLEKVTLEFDRFFSQQVSPYLMHEQSKGSPLRNREQSREEFDNFRRGFPEPAWKPISAIEEICEEKRQLDHQARLHRVLHAWLLVHLPLSAGLILLAIIHAIGAVRY